MTHKYLMKYFTEHNNLTTFSLFSKKKKAKQKHFKSWELLTPIGALESSKDVTRINLIMDSWEKKIMFKWGVSIANGIPEVIVSRNFMTLLNTSQKDQLKEE